MHFFDAIIHLKSIVHEKSHYNENCIYEYIAVVCLNEEDGIEILSQEEVFPNLYFERRVSQKVCSQFSTDKGRLRDLCMEINDTLLISSAVIVTDQEHFLCDFKIFLWLFEIEYPTNFDAPIQNSITGKCTKEGSLVLPRLPKWKQSFDNTIKNKELYTRQNYTISLLGISLLFDSTVTLKTNVLEDARQKQRSILTKEAFFSKNLSQFSLYTAESMVGKFFFYKKSCVLPSLVKTTDISLKKIGLVSCNVHLTPSVFPRKTLSISLDLQQAQDSKTEVESRFKPLTKGFYFHLKNIQNVNLSAFIQDNGTKGTTTKECFDGINKRHILRLFWKTCHAENESLNTALKLLKEPLNASSLTAEERMHGKWVSTSGHVVYSPFSIDKISTSPQVDFEINEHVYMTLPKDGTCILQCVLIIQPNKGSVFSTTLEETVLFTLQRCISVKNIKKKKTLLLPLTLKNNSKQCIAYLSLDIQNIPRISVVQKPTLLSSTTDDTSLQCLKGPFVAPSFDLLYNNIYSLLTMSAVMQNMASVRQAPVEVVKDVSNRVPFNKQKFDDFFTQPRSDGQQSVLDATIDDIDSLWIVNGNPDKCITAGQKYVLIIDHNKLTSSRKWNKDIVRQNLKLNLIRHNGLSIQLQNKEDVFCPVKASHQFKWRLHASEYLATVSFEVYSAGNFSLYICLFGINICSSPFPIQCFPSHADPLSTIVETFNCMASADNSASLCTVTDFNKKTIDSLKRPMFLNKTRFSLCDVYGNTITSPYNILSSKSLSKELTIFRILNYGNGIYDVFYHILVSSKLCESTFPSTSFTFNYAVFLNREPICGSPFCVTPENINEIKGYYDKLKSLPLLPVIDPMQTVFHEDQMNDVNNYIMAYQERFREDLAQALSALDAVFENLHKLEEAIPEQKQFERTRSFNDNLSHVPTIEEAHSWLSNLKQRWILSFSLKNKLDTILETFKLKNSTENKLFAELEQYQKQVYVLFYHTSKELEFLKTFQSKTLHVVRDEYEKCFKMSCEKKTKHLVELLQILSQNKTGSLEELVILFKCIIQECNNLNLKQQAQDMEKMLTCTIQDKHVTQKERKLLRTSQSLKSLEELLDEKEKLLEEHEQKFSKTSKCQPPLEIDEDVFNKVSQGFQTDDPYNAFHTKLAPMIAYRLTGRSPYILLPEDPKQLHQISRRESMSQQLQAVWRPVDTLEILKSKKILKSCPRIKKALHDVFTILSGLYKIGKHQLGKYTTCGIVWSAYQKFCSSLNLSSILLNDVTALYHLFLKFSLETGNSYPSAMGKTRVILETFWFPFLRELAYLDMISTLVENKEIFDKIAKVTRVSSLYNFLSQKFLPYYSTFMKHSEYQSFQNSLLTPRQPSPMTLTQDQDMHESDHGRNLSNEIKKLLDMRLLQDCYDNLKRNKSVATKTTNSTQMEQDEKLPSLKQFYFYLITIGFIPNYISLPSCVMVCKDLMHSTDTLTTFKNVSNQDGWIHITFEKFVALIVQLLIFLSQHSFNQTTILCEESSVFYQLNEIHDIIKLMEWG